MSESREPLASRPPSDRVALGLAVANSLLMLAIVAVRWLRDGSFWLDEASIAINLLERGPAELLLEPYPTGHSFPRLYLVPISLLMQGLGYHTWLLRLLPVCAFAAGALAWNRLLYVRCRRQPALLGLAIVLNLIPATWFAYGPMLKQYGLDVCLALLPFLLSDAWLEGALRAGRARHRLVLLALPCLLSFTYVIPLVARCAAWYVWGLRRGERRVDARAAVSAAGAIAASLGLLWWIDLRHTTARPHLLSFWAKCIPANDWQRLPELLGEFFGGWYRVTPFGAREALPEPLIALLLGWLALGSLVIARRTLAGRGGEPEEDTLDAWGSRSLAAVGVVLGLIAASLVVQYPLCSGRLTLFALFSLQLITLEGLAGVARWLPGARAGRHWTAIAPALLALLCLPAAGRSLSWLVLRDTPENIRPLLHHIDEQPELPIVVAACSTRQISTLPELLGREDILYFDERRAAGLRGYPETGSFWLISTGSGFYCPGPLRRLRARAEKIEAYQTPENTAALLKVTLPAPQQ